VNVIKTAVMVLRHLASVPLDGRCVGCSTARTANFPSPIESRLAMIVSKRLLLRNVMSNSNTRSHYMLLVVHGMCPLIACKEVSKKWIG